MTSNHTTEPSDAKERAREILNSHMEYVDGLRRGQIHMRVENALAAVEEALATTRLAASREGGEHDRYGWKHHWDRFDRPRTCINCGYTEHDGSGCGYKECPNNPAALASPAPMPEGEPS